MKKITSMYYLLFLIFVTNTQAKIWFAGDTMPGTNKTISEEGFNSPIPKAMNPLQPILNINMDQVERIIGRGVTKMALSLENVVGTERDNLIFAPVSVAAALSVILLGAAGKTSAEISNFLGLLAGVDFTDRTDIVHKHLGKYFTEFEKKPGIELGTQLAIANGIFIQEGYSIKPKFDEMARKIYRSEVMPLDFLNHPEEARLKVNDWVSNRTNGRIKDILPNVLSPLTSIVVTNAFYFNGEWEFPFYGKTRVGKFHVNKEESIEMPLMVSGAEIPFHRNKNYTIFGMPYKGGDLIMYIVLPQKNLHKFVADLDVSSIEEMINRTVVQTVLYVVPRMKMESMINLRKPLESLGVSTLFDPQSSDLSGISEGVFASSIYHKVEVQVTETGTVAAAGTASGLIRGGIPVVRVDKPFLFFIYHNPTNTIIFWGSVYKPTPFYT